MCYCVHFLDISNMYARFSCFLHETTQYRRKASTRQDQMMSGKKDRKEQKKIYIGSWGCTNSTYKYCSTRIRWCKKNSNLFLYKMTDDIKDTHNADDDSLLLLLRDAIVQHSPLNDIKLILRYWNSLLIEEQNLFPKNFLSVVNM